MKNTFSTPLSGDDRRRAIALLAVGSVVTVGQVSLYPDWDLRLVWGCDAYGVDFIAAGELNDFTLDFASALSWAEAHQAPLPQQRPHPAELCW